MKVSKLIENLYHVLTEHGDIEVYTRCAAEFDVDRFSEVTVENGIKFPRFEEPEDIVVLQ